MVKTLELIQNYHSLDKLHQDPVKFYKQLAMNLKVDLLYTRQENINFQYDKTAILYFNQNCAHKFIPIVLELDFDSFYPQILMNLTECDKGILKLMNNLQKHRQQAKTQGNTEFEKTIKMLQNTYIGCLGSQKEYCRPVADMYLHSLVMKKSRDTIRKLQTLVQEKGFDCFFIQTDAIFCEIQNEDQGIDLLKLAQSLFPTKIKIHKQFYHWTQTHKYVSLVNDQPLFKAFAKNCEFFGQYIDQFIRTQDPKHLLEAYDNPETIHNQTLLCSLSKAVIQFPQIIQYLEGRVLIRRDFMENKQLRRLQQFVKICDLVDFIDAMNIQHQGLVAFHEVIIQENNLLVFDIDCKDKIDVEILQETLWSFVINHPIIKQFFKQSKVFTSSYQNDNKTSIHMTFSPICLPLHIQQQLAVEAKQKISEYIDTQIYAIGKSLRLPECPNVKNGYTNEQMILSTLKIEPYFRIQDYLFTKCNKIPITNTFVTECLFKKQYAINYSFELTIDHMETISKLISQVLKDNYLHIRYMELTKDNLGVIMVDDYDANCIICKRKHESKDNRTKLRFVVLSNDVVRISCFQQHLIEDEIQITIPSGSLTKDIRIEDKPLKDAKIINQQFILKNKTDSYNISKYQCHIIKSSLGSGKSEVFAQQFKKFKKVLLISVRKCYTFANQKRFDLQDQQLYFHQGIIKESAICQVESLSKVSNDVIFDLIIIDEFQSVLQQLYKPDKQQCLGYITDFLRVLQHTQRLLVCDANLEQSSINWLINSNSEFEYIIIENLYQTFKGNEAIIYNEFDPQAALYHLKTKIIDRFDNKQKSWLIISQKNYQEDLARIIKSERPQLQLKIFNGNLDSIETDKINDQNNTDRQLVNNIKFFKDGNKFGEFDLILATSTITSGLDVPVSFGFDFVGGLILTQQFNCQQLIQALHRPRSVKCIEIFCQSLQTRKFKQTFFDHFIKGISTDSHIDLHKVDQQLYSLCHQYTYDLQLLGIEYLYFWLQKMGYNLQIKTFNQQQQLTPLQINETTIIPYEISQSPDQILERFMAFIPFFEVKDPYLMEIQNTFKYMSKNMNQQLFNDLIELSRYQITASFQSEGYNIYFEDKDWEVDPIQYTDVLKMFFSCGYNISWNQIDADFTNMEVLFKFVVQYCSILKTKGKTFLKDFLQNIRLNMRMRSDLKNFITSQDFNNKKERYRFYRLSLNCPYMSEKCVEKQIQLVKRDNLLELSTGDLIKTFYKPEYLKIRGQVASYLGYHSVSKRKRVNKERMCVFKLYNSEWIPEAF